MVTLFDVPLSPYAQKVKLALVEKGIPFEVHPVDLWRPDEAFLAVSPRAQAPALLHDKHAVFDSTIILEYLEEAWPDPPLLPESSEASSRARMIEDICDTAYDAVNWSVMEVTVFRRAEGELAEKLLSAAREQVLRLNTWLGRQLGKEEWFSGPRCLRADLSVYPYVNGAAAQGNKPAAGSELESWLKRMRGRPSAARVRDDVRTYLKQGPKTRPWRTYRDHRLEWLMRNGGHQIVLDGVANGTIRWTRNTFE